MTETEDKTSVAIPAGNAEPMVVSTQPEAVPSKVSAVVVQEPVSTKGAAPAQVGTPALVADVASVVPAIADPAIVNEVPEKAVAAIVSPEIVITPTDTMKESAATPVASDSSLAPAVSVKSVTGSVTEVVPGRSTSPITVAVSGLG